MLNLVTTSRTNSTPNFIGSYTLASSGETIYIPTGQAGNRCQACSSKLLALLAAMSSDRHSNLNDHTKSDMLGLARDLADEIDNLIPLVEDDGLVRGRAA